MSKGSFYLRVKNQTRTGSNKIIKIDVLYLNEVLSKCSKCTEPHKNSLLLAQGTMRVHEWDTTRPLIVLYDFTPSAWRTRTIAPVPDRALLRISRSCGTYRRVRFAHYVSFVRCHERHLRMAGIINPFSAGWVSHRSYVPYAMGVRRADLNMARDPIWTPFQRSFWDPKGLVAS